jgi:HEAT repeat protein
VAVADDCRSLPTGELISLAREVERLGRPHGDPRWGAVVALHERGTEETLAAGRALCSADDPVDRRLGCLILGELGGDPSTPIESRHRPFREQVLASLFELLEEDEEAGVLRAAAVAVGWWADLRSIDRLLPLADHADAGVRLAAVSSLVSSVSEWNAPDDRVLDALLGSTRDPDAEARYSAVHDLAAILDSGGLHDHPAVRKALQQGLADADPGVREGARQGLSALGD